MKKLLFIVDIERKKIIFNKFFIFCLLFFSFYNFSLRLNGQCTANPGEITGKVLKDTNFNGLMDDADIGLKDIKVLLYDQHQTLVNSVLTDDSGLYKLSGLTDGKTYRIEFNYPDFYYPAKSYKDILFLTSPSCNKDLLLHVPTEYKSPNPLVSLPMFLQGKPAEYVNYGVLYTFPKSFNTSSTITPIIKKSDVGAVWGNVFKRSTQQIFNSAFIKQYAFLGPNGKGAIYVTSKENNIWKTSLYVDLVEKGIDLGNLTTSDAQNCNYGAMAGYYGLGSLAISNDEKYLYTTNLYKNTLIKIPTLSSKLNEITEVSIPNPGCIGGKMHPFALKYYNGKLYLGVSCSAEYSKLYTDNQYYIYEYDDNLKTFNLIFNPTYSKGYFHNDPSYDVKAQWWLTDIDFTDDGNMILVFNDRTGHRYCDGTNGRLDVQNGDILIATKTNGVWNLESNGKVGNLTGSGVGNAQGPGGGEFFSYDFWPTNPSLHPETVTGSALVLPGDNEVLVPVYDPEVSAYSGGIKRFNTTNGNQNASMSIYTHQTFPQFGKASGFGDVEAIYDPMPLEIGDYVWIDDDKDGIQDPNESGIGGVSISLYDNKCNKIAITTTDVNGHYVFNNKNVDLNGDGIFDNLEILKNYYVVIDDSRFANEKLTINSKPYYLTISDKGVGINMDKNDSDATIAKSICSLFNGKPYISVWTLSSGQNNYDADFGFSEIKIFDLALKKTCETTNTVKYGDIVTFKITVYNQGTIDATNIKISDYINTGYEIDPLKNTEWVINQNIGTYTYNSILSPGNSFDTYISLKVRPNVSLSEFINRAEITSATDKDGTIMNDVDSKADNILGNDKGGVVNYGISSAITITDDLIDDDGNIDEDDEDPATISILDLALQKIVLNDKPVYKNGDTVIFGLNVYNQGSVTTKSFDLTDYLTNDFVFVPSKNPNWTKNVDGNLYHHLEKKLEPFQHLQDTIILIINDTADVQMLENFAEISNETTFTESSPKDYDSTPNNIESDDKGAEPGTITQHNISLSPESTVPDEDDHDVATLNIYNFDLALKKTARTTNLAVGDVVTFDIEVFNQGSITADNISLVDYLEKGFYLHDTKWNYYPHDSSKVEIVLTKANGYLPPFGLLPGKSVSISIALEIKNVPENIDFLTNYSEIKSATDIAGNNFGIYDKDSYPDDNNLNDKRGLDNQLNGNGINDEDDHDWATIFIRTHVVLDPCICKNNAYTESDGQFIIKVGVISPSGQGWYIDDLLNFYDISSPAPPALPILYSVGTVLTELVDDPKPGLSTYYLEAIHIDDIPYYIRFKNNLGDTRILDMNSGLCSYEKLTIVGSTGSCRNGVETYSVANPNPNAVYTWSLNAMNPGGTFIGSNVGNSVQIQWGNNFGVYELKVVDGSSANCIAPKKISVKIGNSSGALTSREYQTVSVDNNCEVVVTPDMILTTPIDPNTPFEVILYDPQGQKLPSNVIPSSYIGIDINVILEDQCSGQKATTTIKAVDFISPVLDCSVSEISCDQLVTYQGPVVSDNCDPDPFVFITNETMENHDCSNIYLKTIYREYKAIDKFGNVSEPCNQTINLLRFNKDELEMPSDFLISNNTALTCNSYATDKNGFPDPSVTGTPKYHGKDLYTVCNDNVCGITVGYHDFYSNNDCCYKRIIRIWYVFENCDDIATNISLQYNQIIEIHDLIPPVPSLPANMYANTSGLECNAKVNLPVLTVTDNCSEEITVDIIYPGGVLKNSNGGLVTLPVGVNDITYNVYDKCNNLAQVHMTVTVADNTPPVAICQQNTIVSLNTEGEAYAPALSFDSGSYDDCQLDRFEVKRMYKGIFGENVRFDCNDLDSSNIRLVLRVYDIHGNWNECMINTKVQYKYPPVITCPSDMEVNCDYTYEKNNLSKYFGEATGEDKCGFTLKELTPEFKINTCGVGTVKRSFEVKGRGGQTSSCFQTINFTNQDLFTISDIEWPKDASVTGCGQQMTSPQKLGFPILKEDICDQVSFNYSDKIFYGAQNDACYTIVRTWEVVDFCQYNSGLYKKWFDDQLIHVKNNVAPTINNLQNLNICTYDNNCKKGFVELIASGNDDCTDPDDLSWKFSIDLFDDGKYDKEVFQFGSSAIASDSFPIGNHRIVWTVEDRCGNTATKTQYFTIKNCKKPSAVCKDILIVELTPNYINGDSIAEAQINAEYLNCCSSHSCGFPLRYSFSEDVSDTTLYLDCSWLSKKYHTITLYVTDNQGNFDVCSTKIEVQDNGYICDPFSRCIAYPPDSIVIEECNPDLIPGHGLMDSLTVNNDCNCNLFTINYNDKFTSNGSTCKELTRTWNVDFNCPKLDTTIHFIQKILIKNSNSPTLTCPNNIVVYADQNCEAYVEVPMALYSDDGCNSSLVLTNNSSHADHSLGSASGTYPLGVTTFDYILTNSCNKKSICSMTVTVNDNMLPQCKAKNITVALNANGNVNISGNQLNDGSTDNCGVTNFIVVPSSFNCSNLGDNTVTLSVYDASGNHSNCNAIVNIIDTLTQLCNAKDATITLNSNGTYTLNPLLVYAGAGGCGGTTNVSLEVHPSIFNCTNIGNNNVQLIVTDNVTGEKDTCYSNVFVKDLIAPQCLIKNATIYLNSNGNATITFADINNGSYDPCGIIVDTQIDVVNYNCLDVNTTNVVHVTLTDNSGNTSSCQSLITVQDTIKPICVAADTLEFPLDNTGMAVINGQTVDYGSYDECQYLNLSVNPDTFYCNDAGIPTQFILTVGDGHGNFSSCTGIIIIRDTLPPEMICPPDTTLSCVVLPVPSSYDDIFGIPQIHDNCSQGGNFTELILDNVNACGDGLITRSFSVHDPSNNVTQCTQLIHSTSVPDLFSINDITWPEDTISLENCSTMDPELINSIPIVNLSNSGCAKISISYVDINLNPGLPCLDTIKRTWTIVDSCQYYLNSNSGVYSFVQILFVNDTLTPIITINGPTNITVPLNYCDGLYYVSFNNTLEECDPNVIVTNDSPYAESSNSVDISGYYPEGVYNITISASDHCGHTTTKNVSLTVDYEAFRCHKALFTIEEPEQIIVASISEFLGEGKSNPDCYLYSFSNTDPYLDTMSFSCADVIYPTIPIKVSMFTFNGELVGTCNTIAQVIDPNGYCSGNLPPGISGKITTIDRYGVENAEIRVTGDEEMKLMTQLNGDYKYMPQLIKKNYKITPYKNDDPLNGVTTSDIIQLQKHILKIKLLDSPYKIIAGDIDNNKKITASDISNLRKLILGETNGFEKNTSWKCIDKNYIFDNPDNPLIEDYPMSKVVENINGNINANFIGIKIGDLNNTAIANREMLVSPRSSNVTLYSDKETLADKSNIVKKIIKLQNKNTIQGIQFTLSFDPVKYKFKDLEGGLMNIKSDNYSIKFLSLGKLTVSWNSDNPVEIPDDGVLFYVEFEKLKGDDKTIDVQIDNSITSALIINSSGEEHGIEFRNNSDIASHLIINYIEPNPWSDYSNISFNLPNEGNVKIKVTNNFGSTLLERKLAGIKGKNVYTLHKSDFNYTGLIFVEFEFEGQIAVSKVIKFQ